MNKRIFPIVLLCAALCFGCHRAPLNMVTQVSTIDALLAGSFDGQMTCRRLLGHGDFGIGTFDRLDGEMIVMDGAVYQVRGDGSVRRPDLSVTTPFACALRFQADKEWDVSSLGDGESLQASIDKAAPDLNRPCALRIHGRFAAVKTRSVPPQNKPYPPLAEVTKSQPTFSAANIEGTLIGFRLPAYLKGVNVPGYHLHFLSDDRRFGGHVLEVSLQEGRAQVDACNRLLLILPEHNADFARLDLAKDRSQELNKAEK